jgi:hypothetical protein
VEPGLLCREQSDGTDNVGGSVLLTASYTGESPVVRIVLDRPGSTYRTLPSWNCKHGKLNRVSHSGELRDKTNASGLPRLIRYDP